jgi:membrane-anchored glycerophosphoryl diester phosphodiesterase (GDPDase)
MMPSSFSIREALTFAWSFTKKNLKTFWEFLIYYRFKERYSFSIALIKTCLDLTNPSESKEYFSLPQYQEIYKKFSLVSIVYSMPFIIYLIAFLFYVLISPDIVEHNSNINDYINLFFYFSPVLLLILAVRLGFSFYLVVEKNLNAIESLKRSWQITKKHTLKLLLFFTIGTLINALGFFLFLIGLLWTIPTTILALTFIYRKISSQPEKRISF